MLNVFTASLTGCAFLLLIRSIVARQKQLDPKSRANFGQLLIFNGLLCFAGFYFYGQNYASNVVWFGSDHPSAQDYALLATFGISAPDWPQIALFKFIESNVAAFIAGVVIFGLNYAQVRRYRIGDPTVWVSWALRMTACVLAVYLLAAVYGNYLFAKRWYH